MWHGKINWIVLSVLTVLAVIPQVLIMAELGQMEEDLGLARSLEKNIKTIPAQTNPDAIAKNRVLAKTEKLKSHSAVAALFSAIGIVLVLNGLLLGSKRFFNTIVLKLENLAGKIDVTSYSVKMISNVLADDTHRQAAAIMQTAQTLKNIASLSLDNASHAGKANQKIENYAEKTAHANKTLSALRQSMDDIQNASSNIKTIVHDIEDIASKTAVLAINAGVESVKSGAAGSTFGVIAEEVRLFYLFKSAGGY